MTFPKALFLLFSLLVFLSSNSMFNSIFASALAASVSGSNQHCMDLFDYDEYKYKIVRYHQHIPSNEKYLVLDDLEEHFTLFCQEELTKQQIKINQTYRSKLDQIAI